MKRQLTKILNLPGVIVKSHLEKTLVLEVEKSSKTARCPRCGQLSHRLHQNHFHLIKDLSWGEQYICELIDDNLSVIIVKNQKREPLEFVGKRKKYTDRYARFITEQVIRSDLLNVAVNNNLTESEVESMFNHVAELIFPINLRELKRLGIDDREFSQRARKICCSFSRFRQW